MNAVGIIARSGKPYTITRIAASAYDSHGRAVAGGTSTLAMVASVQPVTGRDLQRMPEGLRTRELVKLYTTTQLRTADEGAGTVADRFAYRGATWEVQTVEDWADAGNYFKCIAAKVPPT